MQKIPTTSFLNLSDNFMLSAKIPGTYVLQSPIQKINGLQQFNSFFGFMYSGLNSQIKVTLVQVGGLGSKTDLHPQPYLSAFDLSWNYFSKNLTNLLAPWSIGQEWQVSII